ncbi:RDD family protein [Pseudoclavibacter chungangensis]|uniref:RDD family protein n=1 Tax=Pseudoclavibacter chungangensis TaxID=587635 RepID=A0A7J5BZC7_9MICO|nr:RDD family protein [Pseudoclavibacter chungangensis]KAB1659494.1 RDD family protein [Pseudoclavibacter chungangensis]NYJ67648.1 putative RDD family membrane protein YckC [Pseudoclavibacter chungangensis]
MSTVRTRPDALDVSDERVVIGEGVALDVRPAGIVTRIASAAIDVVATWIVAIAAIVFMAWVLDGPAGRVLASDMAILSATMLTTVVVLFVLLPALVEIFTNGRSLGRLVMGIRIVRDDGGASGPRQAFIRSLVGFFEIYMTSGGIAVLVGLFNGRSKRIGDILAGTYAQNERVPRARPSDVVLPAGLEGWASIADVARLPDPVARRVRDYLVQAPKLEGATRPALAGRVARDVAPFVHPIPDVDADTFLRAVAAVRRDREYRALQLSSQRLERLAPVLNARPHGFPDRG